MTSEKTNNEVKKKMFTIYITDKRLVSQKYEEMEKKE